MRTQADYSRKQRIHAVVSQEVSDKVLVAFTDTDNALDLILSPEQAMCLLIALVRNVNIQRYQHFLDDAGITIKEDEN